MSDILRDAEAAMAQRRKQSLKKQDEVTIFNNCKKKYNEGKVLLENLLKKQEKLNSEISHLQQKQADRKKFLEETYQRLQKN
jgi:vacuolar-type H+-ATPase subunit I/STV1